MELLLGGADAGAIACHRQRLSRGILRHGSLWRDERSLL